MTIARVLYGEFGDDGNPGPVIDLTEFVDLLDWMNATDRFIKSGNSQELVGLVKDTASTNKGTPADQQALMEFAVRLDDVSRALYLAKPDEAMKAGYFLQNTLDKSRKPMQRGLQPFLPLVSRVKEAFADIAQPDPQERANIWNTLAKERDIVYWYRDRNLWLQAIAVAYEWLITYGLVPSAVRDLTAGRGADGAEPAARAY